MLNKLTPIQYAIRFGLAGAAGAIVFTTLINWTQPDNTLLYGGLVAGAVVGGLMVGFLVGKLNDK